jgi:hypothetical protein
LGQEVLWGIPYTVAQSWNAASIVSCAFQ